MKPDHKTELKTLGFIGGGQMAEALIKGILASGIIHADRITVSDLSPERRKILEESHAVHTTSYNRDVAERSGLIIIAVKPQNVGQVLADITSLITPSHLLISIAAGIRAAFLEERLPAGTRVVRVMPNTPALVQEGVAAVCPGSSASAEDLRTAAELLGAVGQTVTVTESSMDAVTGLSGSGPAYVFTFIEGLTDAGVREGLTRDIARKLAIQTVLGSALLCRETGRHPAELTDMVTSPGGTTIAGLHTLEKGAFRGIIMDAVRAAAERSAELG